MATKKISEKIEELKSGVDWFYSDDFELDKASSKYKELTVWPKTLKKIWRN